MPTKLKLLIIVSLTLINSIYCESICTQYNNTFSNQCNDVINYQILTYPELNITQQTIYESTKHLYYPIPLMDYDCAINYLKLMCPTNYRPCFNDIYIAICYEQCLYVNEKCSYFFHKHNISSINCNQTDPLTGIELWPANNCIIYDECKYSEHNISKPCINKTIKYMCPKPLIFVGPNSDEYTGLPCSSKCSDKLRIQQPNFDDMFILVSVINWISFVCVIFVCLIYLIYPMMRKMPRRIILFMGIGMTIEHMALIGNSMQDPNYFLCHDNIDLSTDKWARFSGYALIVGAMITASWWMIESFVLFYYIGLLRQDKKIYKYEWLMHIWCWGYPITTGFIFLFVPDNNGLGAVEGIPWAFNSWKSDDNIFWGLFYSVLILYMALFIAFMSVTILRLINIYNNNTISPLEQTKFQLSLFIFTTVFFVIAVAIIANKSWNKDHLDDIEKGLADWYECILTWQTDCKPSYYFSEGLTWFMAFCMSIQGLALFIIFFVLSPSVYTTVKQSVLNLWVGNNFYDGIREINSTLVRSNSKSGSHIGSGNSNISYKESTKSIQSDDENINDIDDDFGISKLANNDLGEHKANNI